MGMKGALGRDQFKKCLEFFLKGDNIFQTIKLVSLGLNPVSSK